MAEGTLLSHPPSSAGPPQGRSAAVPLRRRELVQVLVPLQAARTRVAPRPQDEVRAPQVALLHHVAAGPRHRGGPGQGGGVPGTLLRPVGEDPGGGAQRRLPGRGVGGAEVFSTFIHFTLSK